MACGCKNKIKRGGLDGLNYVTDLAIKLAKSIKQDVTIYKDSDYNGKTIYNFTPYINSRYTVIEVIKWRNL